MEQAVADQAVAGAEQLIAGVHEPYPQPAEVQPNQLQATDEIVAETTLDGGSIGQVAQLPEPVSVDGPIAEPMQPVKSFSNIDEFGFAASDERGQIDPARPAAAWYPVERENRTGKVRAERWLFLVAMH
jgi:hypothetical protein